MTTTGFERALVVGAGVSGLTTAVCLHQRGIQATIVSEKFMPHITSAVAGALWEWPPAICGYHHDEISLERSKRWCMVSYRKFETLSQRSDTGVFIRPVTFYFRTMVEEHVLHLSKMQEISQKVPGFLRDPGLIAQNGVNQQIGLKDAYQHMAPMVDTDVYMAWLLKEVQAAGVNVVQRKLSGDLRESEAALKEEFGVGVIVNCSGLGAQELAGEPMFPLRGAVIRLINDGKRFPKLEQAHCVSHDHVTSDQDIVFIVPRGKDRIVLGAIAEADQWDMKLTLEYEPIKRIYQRCTEFMPMLRKAELDSLEPLRVGLRPFRKRNVRLEEVAGTAIVHNYAHGGAGVTFSWGCAMEVAERVQRLFSSCQSAFSGAQPSQLSSTA